MKISIIIPARNEKPLIAPLIKRLRTLAAHSNDIEFIVAANDSTDSTSAYAKTSGAIVTHSVPQRATAMNSGAFVATGEIIYFLHSDSTPPRDFDLLIQKQYQKGFRAGCFRLKFDDKHLLLKFFAWFSRLPVSWAHYGDQSLYVEKQLFYDIGGYDERLSILEDTEIVNRLQKVTKFAILKPAITTSARQYRTYGYYRLQAIYIILVLMYGLGFKQSTLIRLYKKWLS